MGANLTVPYSASIWHPKKISEIRREIFFRKWGFSDMSRNFWSKIGQHSNASGMWDFKVKRNKQTPKDVKLNVLQNGYLEFSNFGFLAPKNQNFNFPKINAKKSKNV